MPTKLLAVILIGISIAVGACGPARKRDTVTVYVSEDQVFSEPILKEFERESGIEVKAVFDTEEAKSTGVMNRLLAEKNNPQADVYWANEPIRAELLHQQGVSAAYVSPRAGSIPADFKDSQGHWTGFSARARVLIVNNSVAKEKPQSVLDYTQARFKGKAIIANPLFGTTTAYVAALVTLWGDDRVKQFMNELKQNGVKITTSNGESADFVASGQYAFALVDSDDAFSRRKQGKPVEIVFPDQGQSQIGCMIVPNAVVFIKGAPHPENARKLIDYLLSKETERKLAFSDAAQIPLQAGVDTPLHVPRLESLKTMQVSYADVAKQMQAIQPFLKDWAGQ